MLACDVSAGRSILSSTDFLWHLDPGRELIVLGSLCFGREEWRTFDAAQPAVIQAWIAQRHAAGAEVWFLLGDVRAPINGRQPTQGDIFQTRWVAVKCDRPEPLEKGKPHWPHAVWRDMSRTCYAIWRLPKPIPEAQAFMIAGEYAMACRYGSFRTLAQYPRVPVPVSMEPIACRGSMFVAPHMGRAMVPPGGQSKQPQPAAPRQDCGAPAWSTASAPHLDERAQRLLACLRDFGIQGGVLGSTVGPLVTRYEFEPARGVKGARIVDLEDDIARLMAVPGARVARIPGRATIGIELPNAKRETVQLVPLLEGEGFASHSAELPTLLGVTITGEPVMIDLAAMPHILIAGTTGSGKSTGINAMILSLLYRLTPEQCRFIMIDPKATEFGIYDGMPHLLLPVEEEPKGALDILKWLLAEVKRRGAIMKSARVRKLAEFNAIVQPDERMPYIVVWIDEMADLLLVAKDVSGPMQRLAQIARAAGVHFVIAMQRPSVDVIAGTIRTNFPARISFQVVSSRESQIILPDVGGSHQLAGNGDMIFMQPGRPALRCHAPFVTTSDVVAMVETLHEQYGAPQYADLDVGGNSCQNGMNGEPVFDAGGYAERAAEYGGQDGEQNDQGEALPIRRAEKWLRGRLTAVEEKSTAIIAEAMKLEPPIPEMTLRRAVKNIGAKITPRKKVGDTELWSLE